jgi:hypothetical protein
MTQETKARDWFDARQRGERLSEHVIPESPVSTPKSAAREQAFCDLCGARVEPHDFAEAAYEASGMNICARCLEDHLDASTFDTRSEVGLARSGGVR